MHKLAMHSQNIEKQCWILALSWNINIVNRLQSQVYQADEILKKLLPGDEDKSIENIPAAVKGALDDMDEKFMQHNGISKIVDITSR